LDADGLVLFDAEVGESWGAGRTMRLVAIFRSAEQSRAGGAAAAALRPTVPNVRWLKHAPRRASKWLAKVFEISRRREALSLIFSYPFSVFVYPLDLALPFSDVPFCFCLSFPYHPYLYCLI
jgi:hypothetical protein